MVTPWTCTVWPATVSGQLPPAGAAIGRAIRLLQQNVGGALPGSGTMAMFGMMRHTNAVFAEDEEGLPIWMTPDRALQRRIGVQHDAVAQAGQFLGTGTRARHLAVPGRRARPSAVRYAGMLSSVLNRILRDTQAADHQPVILTLA